MSALIMYLNEDVSIIAQDTLAYRLVDEKITPSSYHHKTSYFPEFKSVIAFIGYNRLSMDLYNFIHKQVIAFDVDSLVSLFDPHFFDYLDVNNYCANIKSKNFDVDVLGDVSIVGYSDKDKKLKNYVLAVDRDKIEVIEKDISEASILMHPTIHDESIKHDILNDTTLNAKEVVLKSLKQLHADSLDEDKCQGGIGGDIVLTTIIAEPFSVFIETPHRFEDFESQYRTILENLKV